MCDENFDENTDENNFLYHVNFVFFYFLGSGI